MWKNNENWTVEFVSKNAEYILGYPAEEFLESKIAYAEIIYSDDIQSVTDEVIKNSKDGIDFFSHKPYRLITKAGEIKWFNDNTYIRRDTNGNITHYEGIIVDITKQIKLDNLLTEKNKKLLLLNKELEYKTNILKENEKKFEAITNQSNNGITVADIEGNYVFVNPAFCKMSGYSKEELLQKTIYNMMSADQSKASSYDSSDLYEGRPIKVNLQKKNGKKYLTEVTGKVLKINNEAYILGTVRDITVETEFQRKLQQQNEEYASLNEEYRTANEELTRSKEKAEESDKLKTEFFNNMSHEIRTPLNGILGFTDLLKSTDLTDRKRDQFISIIQNSGNQLLRIIDDIIEISMLETKQVKTIVEEVSLNQLLLELFSVFDIKAKESQIPLYLQRPLNDIESTIFTDQTKLNKILGNLLENALKFTNAGFVEFGYKLIENKDESELEIYVKDTGIGIKPEKQELIFQRFSQEEKDLSQKVGGLGLGLSIAKENTELIGGKITLESKKGEGTVFYVRIPYKPVNTTVIGNNRQKKHTILIAEDEEVNYMYLEAVITEVSDFDCLVIHAKNGVEAVEICKNNTEITCVLMDLKMPVMDGFEATERIKKENRNLPIIVQTASPLLEDKNKAELAGCDDYILKPVDKQILLNTLNKYINN